MNTDTKAYKALISCMEREIKASREILSSLMHEEMALVRQNKALWEQIMQSRFSLIEEIKVCRNLRKIHTQDLRRCENYEESFELELLIDQMKALIEKMNLQQKRNQSLWSRSQHFIAMPLPISYPQPFPSKERGKYLSTLPRVFASND